MTSEHYSLSALWGNRPETAAECAERALAILSGTSECDPALARWFQLGRSRRAALQHEVRPDLATLERLLDRGRNRRDADRLPIGQLGFSLALWNGGDEDGAVTMSLRCGGYASTDRIWIPNSFVMELPRAGPERRRIVDVDVLCRILQVVVTSLDPDFAVVTSSQHQNADAPQSAPGVPQVGWMTYLSTRYGRVPNLTSAWKVIPIDSMGSMVVVVNQQFKSSNTEHVAAAYKARKELAQAGLLFRLG